MIDKRDELVGTWKTDVQDADALQQYSEMTLEFHSDGTLLNKIHQNGKDQIMFLTFRVEPGFIVTNQPSHPRTEKTAYEVTKDGKLILKLAVKSPPISESSKAGTAPNANSPVTIRQNPLTRAGVTTSISKSLQRSDCFVSVFLDDRVVCFVSH